MLSLIFITAETLPVAHRHYAHLFVCLSVVLKAASLTVDLCGEEQEPGYCAVSNVAVHTDW